MKRTIYITRSSAFSIQCGGLDRLQVWFTKPAYYEPLYFDEIDNPFGSEREIGCHDTKGWAVHHGKTQMPISFGGVFEYDNEIALFVWKKLCEHFGNAEFREWHNYEKENKDCSIKNFFLKIDLNVALAT